MAMNCVDDVDTILGRMSLPRSDLGMTVFGKSDKLRQINELREKLDSLQAEVSSIREQMGAHGATEELSKLKKEIFAPSTLMSNTLLRVPLETQLENLMRKMVFESSRKNRENFKTLLNEPVSRLVYSVNAMDEQLQRLKTEQKRQAKVILGIYDLMQVMNQRIKNI
jgi:hypothetical protein